MKRKISTKITWILILPILLIIFIVLLPYFFLLFGLNFRVITTNGMKHCCPETEDAFFTYWERRGYNKSMIPINDGLETGDLIFVAKDENYSVGDVVVYPQVLPGLTSFKIHRIIEYNGTHFSTITDSSFTPERINEDALLARYSGTIILITSPEGIREGYELFNGTLIEAYYLELDAPVSRIEGKVVFKLPKLGILHILTLCLRRPECEIFSCLTTGNCNLMRHI